MTSPHDTTPTPTGIRRARQRHDITQTDLAYRIGISESYLSLIEAGKRPLPDRLRDRIQAEVGPIDPDDISLEDALREIGRRGAWHKHGEQTVCPGCGASCMSTAMVQIVYAFRVCDCGDPDYAHLVEQLWHGACYLREGATT
jgi:hypothetical protein